MNVKYLVLLAAPLFSSATLAANYTGPGASATVQTVAAIAKAPDDAKVVLQGQIVRRLKGDIYEFKDTTGTLRVEIDDEDFPAQPIDGQATVRLTGEVDRELTGREVDVEFVERVK